LDLLSVAVEADPPRFGSGDEGFLLGTGGEDHLAVAVPDGDPFGAVEDSLITDHPTTQPSKIATEPAAGPHGLTDTKCSDIAGPGDAPSPSGRRR
jgi:hypothetical protein